MCNFAIKQGMGVIKRLRELHNGHYRGVRVGADSVVTQLDKRP